MEREKDTRCLNQPHDQSNKLGMFQSSVDRVLASLSPPSSSTSSSLAPSSSSPSSSSSAVSLPLGVVLFRGCLNIEEQLALINICRTLSRDGGNDKLLPRAKLTGSDRKAVPILFHNWPGRPEIKTTSPHDLLEFGRVMFTIAARISKCEPSDIDPAGGQWQVPGEYKPDALYGIIYPHQGNFGSHLDGAKSWALSISIGDTATFFYSKGNSGRDRHYVDIRSGDVLVFNGGQLYHGVEYITPSSAPDLWRDPALNPFTVYDAARFVLQMRDPVRDRLLYNPYFYAEALPIPPPPSPSPPNNVVQSSTHRLHPTEKVQPTISSSILLPKESVQTETKLSTQSQLPNHAQVQQTVAHQPRLHKALPPVFPESALNPPPYLFPRLGLALHETASQPTSAARTLLHYIDHLLFTDQ